MFFSKYFDSDVLVSDKHPVEQETNILRTALPGTDLSFDDQCKLLSANYVHYRRVRT